MQVWPELIVPVIQKYFLYEHKQNRLRAMTEVNQNKNAICPNYLQTALQLLFKGMLTGLLVKTQDLIIKYFSKQIWEKEQS